MILASRSRPTSRSSCSPASSASSSSPRCPNTLHTPLMSGTNAIHGIVLLGGLLLFGLAGLDAFSKALLVIAVAFGTINVVGGFLVTDRMLEMFKSKPKPAPKTATGGATSDDRPDDGPRRGRTGSARERPLCRSPRAFVQSESFIYVLYIIAFALFIQGLRGLAGPDDGRARQPHRGGRHGDRGDRDAAEPRRGQLGPDRARHRARRGRRRAGGAPGEDDRDAADGRAVQRRRRRRGRADRLGGVPPLRLHLWLAHGPSRLTNCGQRHRPAERRLDPGRRGAHVCGDLLGVRGDRRLDLLLGLEHRVRQAPGNHPRAPDLVRLGPAGGQPGAAGARAGGRASTWSRARTRNCCSSAC